MPTFQPSSLSIFPWLRKNLGKHALAPMTGTDCHALRAAVQIIELYAYDQHPGNLMAFRQVVERMQDKTRFLAFHAIAHIMDWNDRHTIWRDAGLGNLPRFQPCKGEPRSSALVSMLEQVNTRN